MPLAARTPVWLTESSTPAIQASGMTSDTISLQQVRKVYGHGEGAVMALDALSLTLPSRSFTAIMGPSGSGKSTLLQCAAGLDRPISRPVLIGGMTWPGSARPR